jgi:peptidoglycan/xylan/chitin deacetylase (PgdA/CDA1 family)
MGKQFNLKVHLPGWFTGLFSNAIWHLPSIEKVVYLTFDDGPVPGVTSSIIEILKGHNIKATFFCVGENVSKYPDIFNEIIKEGHAVGNHTFYHIKGIKHSNSYYYNNVEMAGRLIKSNLFRPPYGLMKRSQYLYLNKKYKIIMWDVISCDYDSSITPEKCISNVVDFVRNGSIITFHDSYKAEKNVLAALPKVIEKLIDEGYSFRKIEFEKTRPLYSATWIKQNKMRDSRTA